MKELIPEEYGLVGCELAAAAMVKYYINEVDVSVFAISGIIKTATLAGSNILFKTMSGLPFAYTLKKGRGDVFTKELWITS